MANILYAKQLNYLSSLRTAPDEILRKMEEFALQKKIPILDWKAAEFLEQLILAKRPKRVLEIGTAIAYSSIRIARVLGEKSLLDTIEKGKINIKLAEEFILKAGMGGKINILKGDALDLMPNLENEYDFIFLDADKEDYEKLFHYSLILLRKNGILFVDNLLWHGYAAAASVPASYRKSAKIIREFNRLFVNQTSIRATIYPVGDGIGVGIKL